MHTLKLSGRSEQLIETLSREILILDGAMGTMIQQENLSEADFHNGTSIPDDTGHALIGCNDLLCITRPDVIERIHMRYIDAGARIIETNSFNSNAISLADYGLSHLAADIARAAATVARKAADSAPVQVWVAGSVGPSGKSLAMANALSDRSVSFSQLSEAYYTQIRALIEGGVDLLLLETIFDGLNAKAAIFAARRAMTDCGRLLPVSLSVTLTENGRTLSGQSAAAFFTSTSHIHPLSVGFNCGFGAEQMIPFITAISDMPAAVAAYPNAGLPDALGAYSQTPRIMASLLSPLLNEGRLNIVGGCCGTTPGHIKAIADEAALHAPRLWQEADSTTLRLAGLDDASFPEGCRLIKVGERCNVAGSRKFLRLIKEGSIDEALQIARSQIKAGADIIDINMDDAMLNASKEICLFLDRLGAEPELTRIPVMIDSSDWSVITAALEHVQGRPVVNSISLKEGEEIFLKKARHIHDMGAAVVVMAFDEEGQADTFERRISICERASRLLTEQAGVSPADIIFDPNILTIATGIDAHRRYALDFINATRWIKENLPGARVSGGLSNLSFAFRGNNTVREAMHSVFLHHAVKAGMDMAIINPSTLLDYDSIDAGLRNAIDDVLFDRSDDATDRLVQIATEIKTRELEAKSGQKAPAPAPAPTALSAVERLTQMVVSGSTSNLELTVDAAVAESGTAMAVIEGALMAGMNRVGEKFGKGEMFLPQVVKSAWVMKSAVKHLTPLIEKESASSAGTDTGAPTIILATVKGDVHDIGKNIVSVVMQCNGFRVIDLGVMVEADDIINAATSNHADAIGLSGLITPSLSEMCHVAEMMEERGLRIPLLIGGAAASAEHTAIKIAPHYSGPVAYTHEAASLPSVARRLINSATCQQAENELKEAQQRLRDRHSESAPLLSLQEAYNRRPTIDFSLKAPAPNRTGVIDGELTINDVRDSINVRALFKAWGLDASLAAVADITGCDHCKAAWLASLPEAQRGKGSEAMQLWKEASRMLDLMASAPGCALQYRVVLAGARSEGNDIYISMPDDSAAELLVPTLRRQTDDGNPCPALADFIDPAGDDHIGLFAVTISPALREFIAVRENSGDLYPSMLASSLAHRLVEAATEEMHYRVRTLLWGFAPDEPHNGRRLLRAEYQGIRPAIGYPSLPDQSLVFLADKLLHYSDMDITLTPNGAMEPSATVSGFIFGHPQSRYFIPGRISSEQRDDYSRRRGLGEDTDKFLPR